MIIKIFGYEDFLFHKNEIENMLFDSYQTSFNISKEKVTSFIEKKINSLCEFVIKNDIILFGALEDNILAGFLWAFENDHFGEKRIHINQVVVSEQFRCKGIGTQLIKEVEKKAKNLNAVSIELIVSENNKSALNMYDKLGFYTERRCMNKMLS